jgi:hypothetical protein
MFTKIINFILYPINRYKEKKRLKKRLEELRKRDPFIYE